MSQAPEDGQLHTLGLLEQRREECKKPVGHFLRVLLPNRRAFA